MADNGTVRTLYEDKAKTKPIYPRTVSSAVTGLNGETLQELFDAKEDKDTTILKQSDIVDDLTSTDTTKP